MIRFLTVRPDGSVVRVGVETPKGTRLVKREGNTLVVKVPGHNVWVGLYMPHRYAPVSFDIYRIIAERGDNSFEVERLTNFEARS